ncbi:MAG: hypothetical protein K5872_12710 [Rhizobiaceae bacterium]|nr:hypothetical protein [Rhizobiaceae bacterium]MCV0407078.1 hypothetical protein [Rhizobiaceae bacterium]
MLIIWLGALLVVCGLIYMIYGALRRGRLSGTVRPAPAPKDGTLEPRRHGLGFLGLTGNLPGLALMGAGFLLMLLGAFLSAGTTANLTG